MYLGIHLPIDSEFYMVGSDRWESEKSIETVRVAVKWCPDDANRTRMWRSLKVTS